MHSLKRYSMLVLIFLTHGCKGGDTGEDGAMMLLTTADVDAGTNCTGGGKEILTGTDRNGNGTLDPSEVTATSYVCNGLQGPAGSGITWNTVTETSVQGEANRGYVLTNNEASTVTLPDSANLSAGDTVQILCQSDQKCNIITSTTDTVKFGNGVDPQLTLTAHGDTYNWYAVSISADGQKVLAVDSITQVLTSMDGGMSWTSQAIPLHGKASSISEDGKQFIVAPNYGYLYQSGDEAATWTPIVNAGLRIWVALTSSSDMSTIIAAPMSGMLSVSTDSGHTWTKQGTSLAWKSLAAASDGSRLFALTTDGNLYLSTDKGTTWTQAHGFLSGGLITSSSDGMKLLISITGGDLYTSVDGGTNWYPRQITKQWSAVASSADGSRLFAAEQDGQIYASHDSGVTWKAQPTTGAWRSLAVSADGTKLIAGTYNGQVYTGSFPTDSTQHLVTEKGASLTLSYIGNGQYLASDGFGSVVAL